MYQTQIPRLSISAYWHAMYLVEGLVQNFTRKYKIKLKILTNQYKGGIGNLVHENKKKLFHKMIYNEHHSVISKANNYIITTPISHVNNLTCYFIMHTIN